MSSNALTPLASIKLPDSALLEQQAQSMLAMVTNYPIEDDESYGFAGEELRGIKARQKSLEESRTAITGPMNTALKAVNDLFRKPAALLDQAEAAIKKSMIAYTNKVAEEAREARRKAEELERQAAAEAEARRKEADALAAAGKEEEAAAAMEASFSAEMAVAQATPPVVTPIKVAGISKVSSTYKARVVDMRALVQHALTDESVMALISIDEKKLNQLARALGTSLKYPGVEVYTEQNISARAA
jgi:hypothetical protein